MKKIDADVATLTESIKAAQSGQVMLIRKGKPVAMLVPVNKFDRAVMKRTSSKSFWKKIEAARKQPTLSHHEVVEVFKYIDDGTLSKKDLKDSLDCYEQTRRREDFWQMIAERRKKKANPRTKRAKP